MKRSTKTALIIASVMLIAGLIISIIAIKMTPHSFASLIHDAIDRAPSFLNENDYVQYKRYDENERYDDISRNEYDESGIYTVDGNINSIEINWVAGLVKFELYNGSSISFSETSKNGGISKTDALRYKVEKEELIIDYCSKGINIDIPTKELTILLPSADFVREIEIESASADIETCLLDIHELSAESVSGNINIHGFFTCLDLSAVSGNVIVNAQAQELDVSSISGSMQANGTYANIEAETTSGDISIGTEGKNPNDIEISAVSGNITLALPTQSDFMLDFNTVSGSFTNELALKKQNGKYICGNGGASYSVETTSGDFNIIASE